MVLYVAIIYVNNTHFIHICNFIKTKYVYMEEICMFIYVCVIHFCNIFYIVVGIDTFFLI